MFVRIMKLGLKALTIVVIVGLFILWEVPRWQDHSIAIEPVPPSLQITLPQWDTQVFLRHIKTRLPKYREQFIQAGKQSGIPWILLAAQAYQESRWNCNATSPTGVRGLMMLTQATASDLGITNRLDPQKSIDGGAKYLELLSRQIPERIKEPDRTFIALAAYNVGMGHIRDARTLARRMKKNPDRWNALQEMLPLLAQKKYYTTVPHRYARGWEPVQYVKRIRSYREILEQVVQQEARQKQQL